MNQRRAQVIAVLGVFAQVLLIGLVGVALLIGLWFVLSPFTSDIDAPPRALWLPVWATAALVSWLVGGTRARAALKGAAAFAATVGLIGAAVFVVTGQIGEHLAESGRPVTTGQLVAGLVIGGVVAGVTYVAAGSLAWKQYAGTWRVGRIALTAMLMAVVGLWALSGRDARWERDTEEQINTRALGKIDLLLVLDPHDPMGRALIAEANERGSELSDPPPGAPLFGVKFALAVLNRPAGPSEPLYERRRDVGSRSAFVRAVAGVEPAAGPAAYGSYGRLFLDALQPVPGPLFGGNGGFAWRPDSRRAVVFAASRPPSAAELRSVGAQGVELADALAQHTPESASEASTLIWTGTPQVSLALYLATPDSDEPNTRSWARWTHSTGGRVIHPEAYERDAVLHAIEDAVVDMPVRTARDLAAAYQPRLVLADGEPWRPIDVDELLNPPRKATADRICDLRPDGHPDCVSAPSTLSLLGERDDYIDFDQDVRERSSDRMKKVGTAMYFHVRRHHGLLHVDYWWYFPVNVSPVQEARTCLPGLTLKDLTCYDHEGDWEGVTVTLEPRHPELPPPGDPYDPRSFEPGDWKAESVVYDAHGRSIRWPWAMLAKAGVVEGRHPLAFAARGSHASYPLRCRDECNQGLALKPALPEGPFDGGDDDRLRCRADCLRPMPSLRRQDPGHPITRIEDAVLWNAFPGRWGAAVCLDVALVCSQSDGPKTPSRQGRYQAPWRAVEPTANALERFELMAAAEAR